MTAAVWFLRVQANASVVENGRYPSKKFVLLYYSIALSPIPSIN
jgi:hypothetical protein